MKKFLKSIFFACIMALLIFSVSASANETTRLNKWATENFDLENGLSVKMYAVLEDTGGSAVINQSAHIKGQKIAFTSKINNIDVTFILHQDTLWLYSPKFPFVHIKTAVEGFDYDEFFILDSSVEANFLQSYETTLNSRAYYVEEFIYINEDDEKSIAKYYFDGDKLKFIDIHQNVDGYDVTYRTEILSTNVDDKVFEVPFLSINIYPIIVFFLNIFNII